MAKQVFPKELYDKLSDFVLTFISDRIIDGVTYGMFFSNESNIITKCDEIYNATNDTFGEMNAMRKIEVCNGVVYDVDMSIIKHIMQDFINSERAAGADLETYEEIIGSQPEMNRAEDMKRFAELCINEFRSGKKKISVALFSLSTSATIIVTGKDKDGKDVMLFFPAFNIRQWDMEYINKTYLIPNGLRITSLEVCDILPNRQGVRYTIHFNVA